MASECDRSHLKGEYFIIAKDRKKTRAFKQCYIKIIPWIQKVKHILQDENKQMANKQHMS